MKTYQQILNRLRLQKPKPYTPQFHVKADPLGWRIFDRDRALGLLLSREYVFDLWAFSPFEPDEGACRRGYEATEIIDMHTLRNTSLNLGMQGWPAAWLRCDNALKWTWLKKKGEELRVRVTGTFDRGECASWDLCVSYDAKTARYRYAWEIEVQTLDPDELEGFNMMLAGALEDRAEKRRWTHSLWENADGELRRIVLSNALFFGTDYGLSWRGGEGDKGPWRTRHAGYPQAWVANVGNKTYNPAVVIHETNNPILFATCSQLFDEHILWARAGQDQLNAKGYFHRRMRLEFLTIPSGWAKKLLAKAKDPVRPKKWRRERDILPFYVDRVNTFERKVDIWAPEECPILVIPEEISGRGIFWDRKVGRKDKASIRLEGRSAKDRHELHPMGAVSKVLPHTRCTLRGWIRTKGVTGRAYLELCAFAYSYSHILGKGSSAAVSGTKGWQCVEVEIDTGKCAYVLPKLVLQGEGTAWFDDVELITQQK